MCWSWPSPLEYWWLLLPLPASFRRAARLPSTPSGPCALNELGACPTQKKWIGPRKSASVDQRRPTRSFDCEDDMSILNALASVAVNDLNSALQWYEKLL